MAISFKQSQNDYHQKVNAKLLPIHYRHKVQSDGKANQAKIQANTIEKFYHQIQLKPQQVVRNVVEHVKNPSTIR